MVAYFVYTGAFTALGQRVTPEIIQGDVVMHIHPRIEIYIEREQVTIPANIGIDPKLWKDRSLERYGMPMPEMRDMPHMSPLHTHDTSGTMHVESTANMIYTLGEFFDAWGVNFNPTCILDRCSEAGNLVMQVNGVRSDEFRNHILSDGEQIRIEFRKR